MPWRDANRCSGGCRSCGGSGTASRGALRRLRGAELRGGAGCRLYQMLSGVGPLELQEQRPLLVEQHRVQEA
ncbi:hypothetical protein Q9966_016633 [Columba livia]|nr:hypothetical protein Q9966_016633 [Columba livia]